MAGCCRKMNLPRRCSPRCNSWGSKWSHERRRWNFWLLKRQKGYRVRISFGGWARRMAATALLSLLPLAAAPHQGVVKFGGLPMPGATVTATLGDKKLTAITDPQGYYSFADLADGNWTIRVEMLCFEPVEREVAIAPGAPAPEWELKMLPFDEIKA